MATTTSSRTRTPGELLRAAIKPLASLQLTVVLLAFSVVLVFFGTLAQKTDGIWTVVEKFFHPDSIIAWVQLQHLVQFAQIFGFGMVSPTATLSGRFPIPGGGLIGWMMFLNLLAAHISRFKLSWKRAGVYILHSGLMLLFVGEYITRLYQVEQQMVIPEGDATNYTVDTRNYELAFLTPDGPGEQKVTVVPAVRLKRALAEKQRITHPDLPVDVEVLRYHVNSRPIPVDQMKDANPATAGVGKVRGVQEAGEVSGVDMSGGADVPAAYVRLYQKGTDTALDTFLVSLWFDEQPVARTDGTTEVVLRRTHYYKSYSVYLKDFQFDRYVGTQTAKNYSSDVRLLDPERGVDRTVTIRMNEPLRYGGETFYQADFDKRTETTTILQVVRNPGVLLPYIACSMVAIGMITHFAIGLFGFFQRTSGSTTTAVSQRFLFGRSPLAVPQTAMQRRLPWIMFGVALLFLGSSLVPKKLAGPLDLRELARLPVVDGGRVKPLDSVARVNMRIINHQEQFYLPSDTREQTPLPAIRWWMDTASAGERTPGAAGDYKVFRIEHPEVLDLLGLKARQGYRYSVDEFRGKFEAFDTAVKAAKDRPEKERNLYEAKLLELRRHVELYLETWQGYTPMLLPPNDKAKWRSPADVRQAVVETARAVVLSRLEQMGLPADIRQMSEEQQRQVAALFEAEIAKAETIDPGYRAWQRVLAAYRDNDQTKFDAAVAEFRKQHEAGLPAVDLARAEFETYLNDTAIFYQVTYLYLFVLLLTLGGWAARAFDAGLGESFRRAALLVLLPTLAAHTFTLFGRMYLMDRPLVFVTNLYSSAVFIGWGAVALCLFIERLFPLGLGNWVAAVAGGGTCIIAHNLAASGDTLEMMQAVLDTNFWLATHVTTVTLGYAATYVAGLIAIVYIAAGLLTPALRKPFILGSGERTTTLEIGRVIGMVLYGVICFAALLSFVGTVLGGIWADQSWGRFWGWDPKENGAVLIVAWNALILHARWCGLVKDRGMAVLALVGNMITTWSWFGTNQLGVGLHAYGFSNRLATGCAITWLVHLVLIGLGLLPKDVWTSFRPAVASAVAAPTVARKKPRG